MSKGFIRRNALSLIFTTFIIIVVVVVFWKRIVVTIHSGERGVLYSRLLGGTVMDKTFGEGLQLTPPWNIFYIYNIRVQEISLALDLLTKDGLTVNVRASLRYHLDVNKLPYLQEYIGKEYRDNILIPILTSALRETVGSYRPDEMYSIARQEVQDKIMVEAMEELGNIPIILDNVVVKRITLPVELDEAITNKLIAEQKLLTYQYLIEESKAEALRRVIQGSGIKSYQRLINENMSEGYLLLEGIKATRELAKSPNAKIVIIGNKDGLPLILDVGALNVPLTPDKTKVAKPRSPQGVEPPEEEPARNSAEETTPEEQTAKQTQEEISKLEQFWEYLQKTNKTLLKPAQDPNQEKWQN